MTKKPKDDQTYLSHMIDEIYRIETFSKEKDGELRDYAVARCLEIIGEIASQVSPATKEQHTNIPWRDMVDMRNALIHGYFGVNFDRVWYVVRSDLPELKQQLMKLLEE